MGDDRASSIGRGPSPVVVTAIHAGHDLRPAIAALTALDDAERLREEDPYTDALIPEGLTRIVVHRSRFEVDINRPRESAVYRDPEDAWGLDLWRQPLPEQEVARSLQVYDEFYAGLADLLDEKADRGPFVVLDLHSYNHRRGGPTAAPEDPDENPVVNVGTGSVDRDLWGGLVDEVLSTFRSHVAGGERLDTRENVRFRGGQMSRWVNSRYAGRGCSLALEFKKVFMDEWSGDVDTMHLAELSAAVEHVAGVVDDHLSVRR